MRRYHKMPVRMVRLHRVFMCVKLLSWFDSPKETKIGCDEYNACVWPILFSTPTGRLHCVCFIGCLCVCRVAINTTTTHTPTDPVWCLRKHNPLMFIWIYFSLHLSCFFIYLPCGFVLYTHTRFASLHGQRLYCYYRDAAHMMLETLTAGLR